MQNKLYYGAAYYPELWDEEVIEQDIRLMKETGINVIRIGEFAWSCMEAKEGKIDISYFVNIIKKFYKHGIETIMCTPTPTPPIWMSHGHPERMHVDDQGRTMGHGSRQHVCTNNIYFRERANIITEHMAKEIGDMPGLIGWQLDNEMKCHVAECMCNTCKVLWHQWLENKYGTIENLNNAWGAKIWSQEYSDFNQIPQPTHVPFLHNSSLSTMYRIFSRQKTAEFLHQQANIIRKYSKAPITHNSCFEFAIDNEEVFEALDFASVDGYPVYDNYKSFLMRFDHWRNLKKETPFWVMETSTSYAAALTSHAKIHPKGYLVAEGVIAYAMGAQGFCYWLWRQQRSGCEQPHGSVISAWGEPSVGYPDVLKLEEARKAIEPSLVSTVPKQAEFAITYSDMGKVFLETEPHRGIKYQDMVMKLYNNVLELGIHRDVTVEKDNLEGYKLLWSPFMHYVSLEYMDRAKKFVEEGGIWIIGPMTGGRTENHTIHTDAALGKLEELAGIKTIATYPIDDSGAVGNVFGTRATLELWSSVYKVIDAKVVGTITGGVTDGAAFVTEKPIGKGKVVMLGSMPMGDGGDIMMKAIIDHYAKEARITVRTDASIGTIVVPREGKEFKIWVIVNMDGKGGTVTMENEGIDMVTGAKVPAGIIHVGRYEYKVIKTQ